MYIFYLQVKKVVHALEYIIRVDSHSNATIVQWQMSWIRRDLQMRKISRCRHVLAEKSAALVCEIRHCLEYTQKYGVGVYFDI